MYDMPFLRKAYQKNFAYTWEQISNHEYRHLTAILGKWEIVQITKRNVTGMALPNCQRREQKPAGHTPNLPINQ